jgi:ribulose 1,5-bisphosphate carboxylase large subunit-like protein
MHGHPSGTKSGGLAMKQAIDGDLDKPEYEEAIAKWGKKDLPNDLAYRIF